MKIYLSPTVARVVFARRVEVALNCAICAKLGRTVIISDDPESTVCTSSWDKSHPFPARIERFVLCKRPSTGRAVLGVTYRISCDRGALRGVSSRRPQLRAPFWGRLSMSMTCRCGATTDTSVQTNQVRPSRTRCGCGLVLYYEVFDAPVFRDGTRDGGPSHPWAVDVENWSDPAIGVGGDRPHTIVTLVHGTWARGVRASSRAGPYGSALRWFEQGSSFCDGLSRALSEHGIPAEIARLDWSGANSILARESAARRLAELLDQQRTDHPGSARVVIAHSHGGNVALRAFQFLTDLGSDCGRLSIATLATPFVSIRANRRLGYDPTVSRTLVASALTTLLVRHTPLGVSRWWLHALVWLAGFVIALVALVLAEGVVLGLDPLEPGTRWRLDELISASMYPAARNARLLVLRGANDEAALAIAAGAIGERLTRFSANVMSRLATLAGLRGPVAIVLALAISWWGVGVVPAWALPSLLPRLANLLWLAFFVLLAGVFCLQWLSAVLSGVFRTSCGRELFNVSLLLEVAAESSPDTTYNARVVTFPDPDAIGLLGVSDREGKQAHDEERRRAQGLRHAMYAQAGVMDELIDWIWATANGPLAPSETRTNCGDSG